MATLRPHTREYSQQARDDLGIAAIRARQAAGHMFRPSFAKVVGISVKSILKLETGKPVGPDVYEAVARALPRWTEETPLRVLDGEEPPPTDPIPDGDPDSDAHDADEQLIRTIREAAAELGVERAVAAFARAIQQEHRPDETDGS